MIYDEIVNKNVRSIKPSGIRKFFDIVAEMPDAVSLGVGEPDFVTPWEIRDAAIKSVQKGHTSYTSNSGLLSLRKEISLYLKNRFSLAYGTDEILLTIGASEAIDLSLRTIVSQGDEVLVPSPGYVSYMPNIILTGGVPKAINTDMENEFKLTPQALEAAITPSSRVLIFPYPNNPSGAVMKKEEIEALIPIIKKHNLFVISDEIYAELTYNGTHISIASFEGMRERTLVINGFSKAFAMTGWRLGYVCCPKELMKYLVKIHQYVIMCAPTMSQHAALAALVTGRENDYAAVKEMKEQYNMRRRYLVKEFNDLGLKTFEPLGAFYVFPCVKSSGFNGDEFAERLLKSKKVAVVPGSAFGENAADFVRCSYACSMQTLSTAIARIKEFLKEI